MLHQYNCALRKHEHTIHSRALLNGPGRRNTNATVRATTNHLTCASRQECCNDDGSTGEGGKLPVFNTTYAVFHGKDTSDIRSDIPACAQFTQGPPSGHGVNLCRGVQLNTTAVTYKHRHSCAYTSSRHHQTRGGLQWPRFLRTPPVQRPRRYSRDGVCTLPRNRGNRDACPSSELLSVTRLFLFKGPTFMSRG